MALLTWLLAGCSSLPGAKVASFPLAVPVLRSTEPPPAWAADPQHPDGAAYWAARRCSGDPRAAPSEGCADAPPAVCAAALSAAPPPWDILVACPDPAVGERMIAEGADPRWVGRWHLAHDRWDPRLLDVAQAALEAHAAGDAVGVLGALAARETPATAARLAALWDASPEGQGVLAVALSTSTDAGLVRRFDGFCRQSDYYRCDADRHRQLVLAAHPLEDPAAALASPWAHPEDWLAIWPDYRRVLLDAFERGAEGPDPVVAVRGLGALALADRRRAAAVADRWDQSGTTWEGWDLHTALTLYPDDDAWAARVAAAGGALPAAHLLDAWKRSGMALAALGEGWSGGGPTALLTSIFARVPGDDPAFADIDPDPREPPFAPRVAIYAWWGGERWRVAEPGDASVAAVGLANALLEAMERPERAGLTGDGAWVVVGDRDVLAAAGDEQLVTWFEPALVGAAPGFDFEAVE
jgi:hypothetical protein